MTSPAERQAGFTLIEVLVVLAILSLALGIVAARGPARSPALDLRGAADQVAGSLRLARSQAIARNQDVAFTLDLARRTYQVADGPPQPLPPTLTLAMVAEAGPDPTRESTPESMRGTIRFAPDGSATGGRIRIAAGALARTIGVDWLSGRVTVGDGP